MAARAEKRAVKVWRRVFTGIYLSVTIAAILWTAASLFAFHAGYYRPVVVGKKRISAAADRPDELRSCHTRIDRLLSDLHHKAFSLQARALKYEIHPASEWRNWSQGWKHRWRTVAFRCRLQELAGEKAHPLISRLAEVHDSLAELHLSYSGVVNRFVERYTERLAALRSELQAIRAAIDRPVPNQADGKGAELNAQPHNVSSAHVGPQ
ncbi:MAG: hypothetical protein H6707_19645 [Deltaproteobacteria bacterium]|nr:hypothetical protein [Deltaproteobacteria bacterium]